MCIKAVLLFLVIYLCSSCSVNTYTAAEEAMDNLEKSIISEEVIVEGAFRDLEIGQTKEISIEKLKGY